MDSWWELEVCHIWGSRIVLYYCELFESRRPVGMYVSLDSPIPNGMRCFGLVVLHEPLTGLTDSERYEMFVGPELAVLQEPLRAELEWVVPVLRVVVDGVQVDQQPRVSRHSVACGESST